MRLQPLFLFVVAGLLLVLSRPISYAQRGGVYQQYIPLVRYIEGIPSGYTAYVESDADGDIDLYRVTDGGSTITPLTTNDIDDRAPELSPDGSQLLYSQFSETEGQRLSVMNADGTNRHLLADLRATSEGQWSPDGEHILITQSYFENGVNNAHFYIADPDRTDALIPLGDFEAATGAQGQWSPTQNEVLLTVCDYYDYQSCRLYVVSGETGERIFLYEGRTMAQLWSADGSKVFFTAHDGTDYELYEIRRNGTGKRALTANDLDDTNIRLGVDNTVIVTRRLDPERQAYGLFLVNADQTSETPLVTTGWTPVILDQSEDRNTIVYTLHNNLTLHDVHILDTTTLSDTVIPGENCEPDYCAVVQAALDSTGQWVAFSVFRLSEKGQDQGTRLYVADLSTAEPSVTHPRVLLHDYFQWLPDAPYLMNYLPDNDSFAGIPVLYHAPTGTIATLPLSEAPTTFYYEWRAP